MRAHGAMETVLYWRFCAFVCVYVWVALRWSLVVRAHLLFQECVRSTWRWAVCLQCTCAHVHTEALFRIIRLQSPVDVNSITCSCAHRSIICYGLHAARPFLSPHIICGFVVHSDVLCVIVQTISPPSLAVRLCRSFSCSLTSPKQAHWPSMHSNPRLRYTVSSVHFALHALSNHQTNTCAHSKPMALLCWASSLHCYCCARVLLLSSVFVCCPRESHCPCE